SAHPNLSSFVREWNKSGRRPRIRISTLSEWMDALRAHGDRLPVHRGDWTDFWNFGSASSAREVAINRQSRSRLVAADGLRAAAGALGARIHAPAEAMTAGARNAAPVPVID